ncbi:MAG: SDR family NAD(P)-dependent oxidoreductase [Chlorobiaceae bacterium]|nr:SDR family NAD(P)-dependent oxidoreductase [Chlorobiaceae bacterium]
MDKVVLVTGASGFIGSHLVKRCLRDGYTVKALVRKGNACISSLRSSRVEVIEGDVRDAASVDRAVKGCNIVLHAAALTSDWGPMKDFLDINVGGTRSVCASSLKHGVERLVHISSYECYDHHSLERIDENTPYAPRNASYADTKIASTNEVWEAAQKGLSVSVVYPVWVYGPNDRTLFPLLADGIRKHQMFYWSRNARMSLVYIDNLVDLIMLAANSPAAANKGFLACDGEDITFEQVCGRIAEGIGSRAPSLYLPFGFVRALAGLMERAYTLAGSPTRPLITRQAVDVLASRAFVDCSSARQLLGWKSLVKQDDGISRTLKWLMSVPTSKWKVK